MCGSCLGLLQVEEWDRLEGELRASEAGAAGEAAAAAASAGTWCGDVAGKVAAAIAQGGNEFAEAGVEVRLPLGVLARQVALEAWLAAQADAPAAPAAARPARSLQEDVAAVAVPAVLARLGAARAEGAATTLVLAVEHAAAGSAVLQRLFRQALPKGKPWKTRQKPGAKEQQAVAARFAVLKRLQALPLAELGAAVALPLGPGWAARAPCTFAAKAWRRPLFVSGRYIKTDRGLSQSPWFVDGERVGDFSVEETIEAALRPAFLFDGFKFASAGREDRDVRMLGAGRPFVVELTNARKGMASAAALAGVEAALAARDAGLELAGLRPAAKEGIAQLEAGAGEKRKSYRAVVWASVALGPEHQRAVAEAQELVVKQSTPIRVLHRRSPLVRDKVVHSMALELIPGCPHYGVLDLLTSAGTYVKEFVHGDLGRTAPSLGEVLGDGCVCDILQLDVSQVLMPDIHANGAGGMELL